MIRYSRNSKESSTMWSPLQERTTTLWKRLLSSIWGRPDPCLWCPVRVDFTGDPPRSPSEELIAKVVGERKSVPLHWLEDKIAETLFQAEIKKLGWVLDLGVWGPDIFREEAARILVDIRPGFGSLIVEGEISLKHKPEEGRQG